ncbi:hypothetical protein BDN71DRAFT_1507265 [Pleurotus eryngii]|uniref:Uncharacterized protein n=1 Tax=Pleurotus eryngii TaxID=5323 RepID=A0A9P5ZZ42_PLEER|nr:hypothetical protein BDN71DRAFT_1507265 [Pleurotus eryngii]
MDPELDSNSDSDLDSNMDDHVSLGPYDHQDQVVVFNKWCNDNEPELLIHWPSWKLRAFSLLSNAFEDYQHCLYRMSLDDLVQQTVHIYDPEANYHFMVWCILVNYKWGTLAKEYFISPFIVFDAWAEHDGSRQPDWLLAPIDRVHSSFRDWKPIVDFVQNELDLYGFNAGSTDEIIEWCEALRFANYFDTMMEDLRCGRHVPDIELTQSESKVTSST